MKSLLKKKAHEVKSFFRFRNSVKNYRAGIRRGNRQMPNENISIVFLINFPQSWNSVKSIYEAALIRKDILTNIISLPAISVDNESIDVANCDNEAYTFFENNSIPTIKGNNSDGTWYDIASLKPDYVIYTRPYNGAYPELYRSYNVCLYSKLVYIPYGYSMLGYKFIYTILPEDFILCMNRVYLANESEKYECIRKYPCYCRAAKQRFRYLGFPRFDLYNNSESVKTENNTILWMPRWTIPNSKDKTKSSHFLDYYKMFLRYAREHQDVSLIIRPHPKMLGHYLANGILSRSELDDFFKTCSETGNVTIDNDKDYIDSIMKSDILIADYTSLIAEYLVTEKPIIFCDTVEDLNEEGRMICSSLYHADDFAAIEKRIDSLRKGQDKKLEIRKEIIRKLIPGNAGDIGNSILTDILNS